MCPTSWFLIITFGQILRHPLVSFSNNIIIEKFVANCLPQWRALMWSSLLQRSIIIASNGSACCRMIDWSCKCAKRVRLACEARLWFRANGCNWQTTRSRILFYWKYCSRAAWAHPCQHSNRHEEYISERQRFRDILLTSGIYLTGIPCSYC